MIWTAMYFPTPGNVATAQLLGNVRAPHLGAALRRASEKWPKVPTEKVSVRPKSKAINSRNLKRGRAAIAEIRKAYR